MSILFKEFDTIENINEVKYAVGFDLSSVSSGMSLYDIEKEKLVEIAVIRTDGEDKIYSQFNNMKNKLNEWTQKYSLNPCNCLMAKEKQPIQYGMKTTVTTLISIAKVHGLIENLFYTNKFTLLDIAVPTIRKNVVGNHKADKEEVFKYICDKFPNLDLGTIKGGKDIADAICVSLTCTTEYVKSYLDYIKELKKEMKTYKSATKKNEIEEKINIIKGKVSA